MIEIIDIGVNLTNKSLLADIEAILQRAANAGVAQMVVTGTTLAESARAIELCTSHPQTLVSTCGIHPHHASDWGTDSYRQLRDMAAQPCVRAIGETGLDFKRNFSPAPAQEFAFERQMELAVELQLPCFAINAMHMINFHPCSETGAPALAGLWSTVLPTHVKP